MCKIVRNGIESGKKFLYYARMDTIKTIRERLGMSQAQFARAIGMTQGNISHYELGHQFVPPIVARRIIDIAKDRGVKLSFNDVYADFAEKSAAA